MYVCGVSSRLSKLATNVDGRVGGVRGDRVGVGRGVFVASGVDAACVCWMDAKAVPTALVIAVFGSTVAGAGWHALNKMVARIREERSGCFCRVICRILPENLTATLGGRQVIYSFDSPLM